MPTTDREAELDAIVAMPSDASLVEAYVNEDGEPALRLTERGAAMGRALAMGEDADADTVLDALRDVTGADT